MRAFSVWFRLLLFSFCILTLADGRSVSALLPSRTLTPEEFWQRVDETITTLRGLKTQSKEAAASALDALADQWAQLDSLTLPDIQGTGAGGAATPLDTSFIVSELRKRPYDLDALISIFTNLRNAHSVNPTRSFGAAEIAALDLILQRPEFQWDTPPSPIEEFWNDLRARISEWLDSIFGSDRIEIPIPGEVFTITASILLVLILLYVFRGLFADFITEASMDEEHMAGDEMLTAETALQKAKDISRAGDYRTAVRYLYLSSLLTLDERGLLRFDRSKTNREYLRSVSTIPQLSAPLRDVIDVFDRVWYGFQSLDEDSFQHYVEKVDQLREQKK